MSYKTYKTHKTYKPHKIKKKSSPNDYIPTIP